MDVYEITGNVTGISDAGVNFLQPGDSFQRLQNGQIYRQVLSSRLGATLFAPRLAGETRVMGIFEFVLPNDDKELLAFDTNFLYKYDTGTGIFNQIPFAGSMAAYAGFAITNREDYISGVAYPMSDNSARFVFTGKGIAANSNGSAVFFYDGTSVYDYTDVGDNTDYSPPPQGPLQRATFVERFAERINFIVPTIDAIKYSQGVLYSGIRDSSGNGDKFDVAGSGLLQFNTQYAITGESILGQILVFPLSRGFATLEITRDAFNPYFPRIIPIVVGSNADFSTVSWGDSVKALGKTGAVTSDGRRADRFDNKIPRFTADDIDQVDFDMIYGGFDRVNGQFLWAYRKSVSDSATQDGVLVYNYEEGSWSTTDQRFSCFGQTDLGRNLTWDDIDENAGNPSWAQWDTTEEQWDKIGLGQAVQKTLAGDDYGFIYDINADYDDYFATISGITQASSAVLTISGSAFQVGDLVTISEVTGMTDINNFTEGERNLQYIPYTVTAASPTSVTINYNSLNSPAYVSGGVISKVITFEAETIPFNPYRKDGLRCYVSHLDFLIDNNGGVLKVDVAMDEEESPFKQDIICAPPAASTKAREWVSMSVNQEANFLTFTMKQQSPGAQYRQTSMKIYCEPGGRLNG
jgi:hypothetical protein